MSERTARSTIEAFFAALNASDMEAALALLSEDVILDTREGSREIGRDRFHWYWGMLARHFTERYADIEIMEAPGGLPRCGGGHLYGNLHVDPRRSPRSFRPELQRTGRHVFSKWKTASLRV
ncbi:hypothetical protein GCM10023174_18120 [Chelativorans composti]|uniref:Nuclear transport factor 2 family protein n=1 Tax=Chelativorans composti TaxID=768533 RepID=A0ABW5DHY7_9HYPH